MMRRNFAKPGPGNTAEVVEVVRQAVAHYRLGQVVVASTHGDTGLAVAQLFQNSPVKVVVITHNVGFKEPGGHEMGAETRAALVGLGASVHTGTMPFRSIGTAIRQQQSYSQQDLIANSLRLLGQGMKVCVEIVLMAADAGLISTDDVLAIAGTGRGADTVALIKPASSNKLFDLKVRDILAKPLDW